MWRQIRDREAGENHPKAFRSHVEARRITGLQLSNQKDVISPHKGSINSLQIDLTEGRYLLSAASDASTAVFDIQRPTEYDGNGTAKHNCVFSIDKQHVGCHMFSVSSAVWYPVDTGVFVTGSYDHCIKVWDTNTTQVVTQFKMPGKVYRVAMSPLATSHMLIAAGSEDVQVRLCDISSGAFSHTLSGHRDGVMAIEWSKSSEWVVITGGWDGAIRFWDIRRVGSFRVLDQSKCQTGRRLPVLSRASSSNKPRSQETRKSGGGSGLRLRLHPGLHSALDRATAHYGVVTGLKATQDGLYLLSSGSDSRIRLWDMGSSCNTLVNYETSRLQTSKGIQMATTPDSSLLFVPCMASFKAFDVWSGETLGTFTGHYECVNSCCFNSCEQEIYTGGNDRQILVWSPGRWIPDEDGRAAMDGDSWSD